jgi:membrane-bound inhibitor of C-type lysozyme
MAPDGHRFHNTRGAPLHDGALLEDGEAQRGAGRAPAGWDNQRETEETMTTGADRRSEGMCGIQAIRMSFLVLLLAACATPPGPEQTLPAPGRTTEARYLCSNGTVIRARYHIDEKYADVLVGDAAEPLPLPLATSGSGARYSDGAYELWEHHGTARVTLPNGTVFDGCIKQ